MLYKVVISFFCLNASIFIRRSYRYPGGAAGAQLQTILSSPAVTAALSLPVEMATTVLQQHINSALQVIID